MGTLLFLLGSIKNTKFVFDRILKLCLHPVVHPRGESLLCRHSTGRCTAQQLHIVPHKVCSAFVPHKVSSAFVPHKVSSAFVPHKVSSAFVPHKVSSAFVPHKVSSAFVPHKVSSAFVAFVFLVIYRVFTSANHITKQKTHSNNNKNNYDNNKRNKLAHAGLDSRHKTKTRKICWGAT